MSFDEMNNGNHQVADAQTDTQPAAQPEAVATAPVPNEARPEIPRVADSELQGPGLESGVEVAAVGDSAEWLFEKEEEEEASSEEGYEEEYEESSSEAEDAPSSEGADMASEEMATEASAGGSSSGASAAGASAAGAAGVSSALVWGGLGLAAIAGGAAASGSGGGTRTPPAPTLTLDSDTGVSASDGVTNSATFTVGNLQANVSWEYSLDGGTTWTAGSGSSFEIAADGTYDVVVRQFRDQTKISDNSNTITVTLDTATPSITSGDSAGSLDEGVAAGQVIYESAIEADSGVVFSLKDGSDAGLEIDAETGAVTLVGSPDHETKASYAFTVVATDPAGNASEQAVTLTINDLDEVAPTITSGATATAIDENSGAAQVIYTATATDTADVSGGVTFSLKAGSDAGLSIDASTGAVSLAADPDAEVKASYAFTVVATDAAGNASEQAVTLNINDLDEVAPVITSAAAAEMIDENSGAGQAIYTATASDDGDVSGGVTFSLKAGSDAGLSIDATTGVVTLAVNPDSETKEIYNFTVVATDAAGFSDEKAVSLDINDLDEVAPTITSGATATAIDENVAAGQIIYTATSTDDGDVSGGVVYSLKAGSDAGLTIDAATGAVTLVGSPDHETKSTYSFTVVATDLAGNASEKAVTLGINDLDEVAPTITSGATAAAIDENSGATQVIYTATATDTADVSGGVTFSLKAGSDEGLSIDGTTGAVTLAANPDAETKASYAFTVVATDAAGNASEQAVTLNINDLDEVAPTITSGATAAAIDENSGAAQVVYTATATDTADVSDGVTFSLKAGSDAGLSIDGATGAVTLTANPDAETKSSYAFTVVATDAAGNASEQAVTLNINDLDEVAPTITSGATATAIDENSAAGQIIYTATSTDDGDVSDGVVYSLKAGSDAGLTIDGTTGAVTLVGSPDHETKSSYSFTVVATDLAGNASEQAVTLSINDLDEVAPTITSAATATAIDENSGANQTVYTATATDDGDVSEGVTFSLKAGSDAALSIDGTTGAVTLSDDPDFETKDSYSFTVVATDGAGLTDEQAVTLAINDLDEIPPVVSSVAGDSAANTVTITFNEALDTTAPDTANFAVSQAGNPLNVVGASIDGAVVTLTIEAGTLVAGGVQIVYTPGAGSNVADVAGNEAVGFTQMVVSDGYIRGARIYADLNDNGVGEANELLVGVTTDADGQVSIAEGQKTADGTDAGEGTLLVVGGVNMDTGAVNKLVIKTKAGSTAANPLTTLVETIKEQNKDNPDFTQEEAESIVATGLGITLKAGQSLSDYDPIADTSADAVKARAAVATVAVILATAAETAATAEDSDAVVNTVTANIASELVKAADTAKNDPNAEKTVTFDDTVINTVLKDDNDTPIVTDADAIKKVTDARDSIATAVAAAVDSGDVGSALSAIVTAQAKATDSIAPGAPVLSLVEEADTGASSTDGITKDATADVYVDFDELSTDGTGVVVGDLVEVYVGDALVGSTNVTRADLNKGGVAVDIGNLAEGDTVITATVTDRAGNVSDVSASFTATLDTSAPLISSDGIADVDENDGTDIEVYQAAATDNATVSYSLADGADESLSIDETTGVVTLVGGADFETKSQYVFTVVATDVAGNASERAVTLSINNLDEVAPTITSGTTATAINENSGVDQTIYTATATDDEDISGGFTFSLKAGSDSELSIDATTGAVTLAVNPDADTKDSYNFTVVATDAAGNESEQAVSLSINNLDEVAPTITSSESGGVDENVGEGQVIYTAIADDSADISEGVTFSLKEGSDSALTIDSLSGAVTLATNPDAETQDEYSFTVVATDLAGNASEQAVVIAVNDLDEVAPVVTSGTTAGIEEDSGIDQIVYVATASDLGDISGGVTFSLTADSDSALSIDAQSGEVTLATNPVFATQSSYLFGVVATDAAGNESDPVSVTLTVFDVDSEAPVFTSGTTAGVNENVLAGSEVYDADASDLSRVTFSLEPTDLFEINSATGVVTINESPDFEVTQSYTFTVVATDAKGNADSQTVTLSVADLDDTSPAFESALEGTGWVGTPFVYEAIAVDVDTPEESLVYSLADSDDANLLAIESDSGVVTLKSGVVAEGDTYTFTVIVTDGTNTPTSQKVTVNATNPAISAVGEPVPMIGAVDVLATENLDGTFTLDFVLVEPYASEYGLGVENFAFTFNYDPAQITVELDNDGAPLFETVLALAQPNNQTPGTFLAAAIGIGGQDLNDGAPFASLVVSPSEGAINVTVTDNDDGTQTLDFSLSDQYADIGTAVENFDFTFIYDPADLEIVEVPDAGGALVPAFTSILSISQPNNDTPGAFLAAGIDLSAKDLSDGSVFASLTVRALNSNPLEFTLTDVAIGENQGLPDTVVQPVTISISDVEIGDTLDLEGTQITFSDPISYEGTNGNDVFLLGGGSMDITGGGGIDAFVITADFGDSTAVNLLDFTPGEDVIDMSALLQNIGYVALDNPDTTELLDGELRKYSETSIELLSLLEGNDASFDNSFGFLNDVDNGVIIGFYDANSDADVVEMKTFEINIAEATVDITIDDIAASIGGFIA